MTRALERRGLRALAIMALGLAYAAGWWTAPRLEIAAPVYPMECVE